MKLSRFENKSEPEKEKQIYLNIYLNKDLLRQVRESCNDLDSLVGALNISVVKKNSKHFCCLSPFRKEKTPSLFIDINNGQWYDQGDHNQKGGGVLELVCRIKGFYTGSGLDVYQAGRWLLNNGLAFLPSIPRSALPSKYNYDVGIQQEVKKPKPKKENKPIPSKMSLTPYLDFDHSYLKERGFTNKKNLMSLGIGHLPLSSNSIRFKNRIITQIRDVQKLSDGSFKSVLKGHIGKAICKEEEKFGRYITMKNFEKSVELLGIDNIFMDEAIQDQVKNKGLLIVEGAFDLLRCYDAGIKNVISTLGANLSNEQMEKINLLLKNIEVQKIKIFYDNDEAGLRASEAGKKLLEKKFSISIEIFDWNLEVSGRKIPNEINDPADFSIEQLQFFSKIEVL